MAVNWIAQANKVRKALKKEFKAGLVIKIITDGAYDIVLGKNTTIETPYSTHGGIKSFDSESASYLNPEEVEIFFHSGYPADSIPDLTNVNNIEISAYGKTYKVKRMTAIRPAGVTLMYKAIAMESE